MDTCCYICYYNGDTDFSLVEKLIPHERLKELERFPEERRRQSLLAEALLRFMLHEHTGDNNIQITRSAGGKPVCSLCEVSISHTDGAVAVAFSDGPIGIDIEKLRRGRMRAAKAYFTEAEYELAVNSPDTAFWEIWTRKEAYAKALGTGMSYELSETDTLHSPIAEKLRTESKGEYTFTVYSENNCSIFELTAEEFISRL